MAPQQSLSLSQRSGSRPQHCIEPELSVDWHTAMPQQSVSAEHVDPTRMQPATGAHWPSTQASPLQQSASLVQLEPSLWHVHVCMSLSQSMYPQQSSLVLQLLLAAAQHCWSAVPPMTWLQVRGLQQSDAPVHADWAPVQVTPVDWHIPATQSTLCMLPLASVVQHSLASTQGEPMAWHWQLWSSPQSIHPQQSRELSQWPVFGWQQRGLAGEGWQSVSVPWQQSLALVQSLPTSEQLDEQKRKSQCPPPLQVSPGRQQIWPSPPHPITLVTVPRPMHMFVRKGSQIEPKAHSPCGQQGCPSPPQVEPMAPGAGLAMHMPPMQVAVATQELSGAQQG